MITFFCIIPYHIILYHNTLYCILQFPICQLLAHISSNPLHHCAVCIKIHPTLPLSKSKEGPGRLMSFPSIRQRG